MEREKKKKTVQNKAYRLAVLGFRKMRLLVIALGAQLDNCLGGQGSRVIDNGHDVWTIKTNQSKEIAAKHAM
jgi:hypothetical protein